MKSVRIFVFLLALFYSGSGEEEFLPPYITPCDLNKDFEKCVREQIEISLPHFTKGVPELGVPSIDPVKLDDIVIDGNGLKLTFSEAAMHGLSQSKLSDFKIDLKNEKFTLAFKGNMSLTAKYVVDGQILILPIKGQGNALVNAQNIEVSISSKLAHLKSSDGDHLKLINPGYSYNIEKTTFHFENLFDGSKQLSEATHQFVNENWRQIMDDLAPPAIKPIVKTCVKAINKFFAKVPTKRIVVGYIES